MPNLNANTPYLMCFIRNRYLYGKESEGITPGYIFGVKLEINRPIRFHFQTNNGAVIYQMPICAFVHDENYQQFELPEPTLLSLLQTWDAQSNDFAVTTFDFLDRRPVDVRVRNSQWWKGRYLFTIDDYIADKNNNPTGYASDPDSKCFHIIELENGWFGAYPNNIIRWHNPDFIIPFPTDQVPKFKVYNDEMSSENIDRTYGNSPYMFYDSEKVKKSSIQIPKHLL